MVEMDSRHAGNVATTSAVMSGIARSLLLLVIVGGVALAILAPAAANYAGVCLREMRVLDRQERDLRIYRYLVKTNVLTLRGVGGTVLETLDNGFGYKSYAAFASANPSCCTYSQKGSQNLSTPLLLKASGNRRSFVRIEYYPIWGNGRPAERKETRQLVISNCGVVDEIYP